MKKKIIYLKDYKVPVYKVEKISLTFDLFEDKAIVTSEAIYYKNPESKQDNVLSLNGEEQTLLGIDLDGKSLDKSNYKILANGLEIKNLPNRFNLKICSEIHPEKNTSLMGLYISGGKFATQCESEGFRKICYYLDRPDVMSVFTTKIIADKNKYPVLLSNGNLEGYGDLENGRHWTKWHDPFAKPAYLFALVAGKLEFIEDHFTTMSDRCITLRVFTESHNIGKCQFTMDSLKKAMKWDEDRFGREYDLDMFMIVAIDDFNSAAMENKGLNLFNSNVVLATPESATDNDYMFIERVVGHEYFHNWTGDRVTCRDWFQLSLKEGLTVYRDCEFSADMQSRSVKRIGDVKILKNYQFKEDSGPMSHPVRPHFFEEISNFYTVTVYEKGAEVVRMYETILGRKGFRKGMDLYFDRHDGQAVTTEDFLKSMEDANKKDFSQFQNWYDQAGTPIVDVVSDYNKENKKYTLHFRQSLRQKDGENKFKPFIIPIKFGLINEKGKELKRGVLSFNDYNQSFCFENIESKPIPSLLRGFSSPVKLNYSYSDTELSILMRYDTDDYNRFEAAQTFAKNTLLDIVSTGNKTINKAYLDAFRSMLIDTKIDNSFKAETLVIPTFNEIYDLVSENVDPSIIIEAIEFVTTQIAEKLSKDFKDLFDELNTKKKYKFDTDDIGDRKMKGICIHYLSYAGMSEKAYSLFENSNNMTDTVSSLNALMNFETKQKDMALDSFYMKWCEDQNVIDKWFGVQASSWGEEVLSKIKLLEKHKMFNIKNPNKVRSLYNTFANKNPKHFHAIDGEGYKFIADKVIELDRLNPMIASRLARSLVDWRSLEPIRQKLLKNELTRINKEKNLSSDVSEIIEKALK